MTLSLSKPRSTSYHHGNLYNALVEAGRRALVDVSAQQLSLRHLARMVGVSEAAPSRHFSGIGELLAAIAASGFRDLAALRVQIRDSQDTALSTAFRMMRVYIEFARRHKGLFSLMTGPRIAAPGGYPELARESARSFKLFSSSIEALARESGWPGDQLYLVTQAAWSIEHGVAVLIAADRVPRGNAVVSVASTIDVAVTMLLGAVTAGPIRFKQIVDTCAIFAAGRP